MPPPRSRRNGSEFESTPSLTDDETAAPQVHAALNAVGASGGKSRGGRSGEVNDCKLNRSDKGQNQEKTVGKRGEAEKGIGNATKTCAINAMTQAGIESYACEAATASKAANNDHNCSGMLDTQILPKDAPSTVSTEAAPQDDGEKPSNPSKSVGGSLGMLINGKGEEAVGIKRLDSEVYRPFGSRSRNPSPDPGMKQDEDEDKLICKGGPGKPNCGKKVMDGEEAVECEKCEKWFHSKCLSISKTALTALRKWHGTLVWLCHQCKESLKEKHSMNKGINLEETVLKLEQVVRHNANALNESIRNQEKMFAGQCKLLDMMSHSTPKDAEYQKSYADVLKGVGEEVVERVSRKIDKMPSATVPVQRSNEEVAGLLDEIQDKERRKLNVVIHNMQESSGQTQAARAKGDADKFEQMVKDCLKLIVKTTRTFRVGKKADEKPRLMIVTLANMSDKLEVLKSAAALRDSKWSNVYITPDLTWKEREKGRQLRCELARRKEEGEEHIWIRHGRIVTIPEEKRQPRTPASLHKNDQQRAPQLQLSTEKTQGGHQMPSSSAQPDQLQPQNGAPTPHGEVRMTDKGQSASTGEDNGAPEVENNQSNHTVEYSQQSQTDVPKAGQPTGTDTNTSKSH